MEAALGERRHYDEDAGLFGPNDLIFKTFLPYLVSQAFSIMRQCQVQEKGAESLMDLGFEFFRNDY